MRNFYKVLGVAKTADDQRIKTAFRRRVKTVHPDLNPGNRRAESRFIELRQAYEALSDASTRTAYDAYLAEQRSQSRRRFVHCAGLMMTSFVLTATSALFVMGMAGANVPFQATWQTAVAAVSAPAGTKAPAVQKDGQKSDSGWLTQVAVAAASDTAAPPSGRVEPAPGAKVKPAARRPKVGTRPQAAPSKAPGAKSRPAEPPGSVKDARRHLATAAKRAPIAVRRPGPPLFSVPDETWPPPPPSDEPRYSLGASDLR